MRWVVRAIMVCAAALLACEESRPSSRIGIPGTHDIALVGDLLFVTATDANELRVVDLGQRTPDFVRAPNPLHPLSIPVVERPIRLARDVVWDAEGQPQGGAFIYALSADGQSISVVAASVDALVERLAIVPKPDATITAIAARGGDEGTESTLYFATYDGSGGTLWALPLPQDLSPQSDVAALLAKASTVASLSCGSIQSIAVLPGDRLVYGGRRNVSDPACAGEDPTRTAFLLDPASASPTPLQFGGAVRKLFTQPRAGDGHLDAAARIFAVMDEEECTTSDTCQGVLAVVGPGGDPAASAGTGCGGAVGVLACDGSGLPMRSIDVGLSLIMGADIAANASIALPGGAGEATEGGFLQGVVTTSDGRIVFWNAGALRHFDTNLEGPRAETLQLLQPSGTSLPFVAGPDPDSIALADGAARTETISFTYLGALPGLSGIVVPSGATTELAVPVDPVGLVEVGDQVLGCATPSTVTQLVSRPGGGGTLTVDPPLAPPCTVEVRPASNAATPWVVAGSLSGYLGRIAPGPRVSLPQTPERQEALYYRHPASFSTTVGETTTPATGPQPLLTVDFADPFADPALAAVPAEGRVGYRYELTTRSNFFPAVVTVASSDQQNRIFMADVAGTAAYRPGQGELLVAFPGGDVVLQFKVGNLIAGVASSGAQLYR